MVNLSRHSKRVSHNTELHCINSSEQKWSCRDSALAADKMLKTWIIFLINISPSFVVPYPHRSVQTTSRNQWFSYAHIHTSDDTTMECLWQQLKCCYITLSVNNINIVLTTIKEVKKLWKSKDGLIVTFGTFGTSYGLYFGKTQSSANTLGKTK